MGATVCERYKAIGERPEEGDQDGEVSSEQDTWGAAEVVVCSAWRMLRGDLIAVCNIHKGGNRGGGGAGLLSQWD